MDDTQSRLFVLELSSGGRVLSMSPDGSERKVIVTGCRNPDGIAVDREKGHVYWTDMGDPPVDNGMIERADVDGGNRTTIVPTGVTFTPKQLQLDTIGRKLYWSDREGMRVMRCDLDGAHAETLVQTGRGEDDRGDQTRWCVGIAVDRDRGQFYWTQKGPSNGGLGKILTAGIDMPDGDTAAHRSDIEVLFDGLPEPIDLELDLATRMVYWTDRGDPPLGNTVNRAPMDATDGRQPEILSSHLMEGIGIALDSVGDRMFMTDLAGTIYVANLDGSHRAELLYAQGNLTGIAYAELPTESARGNRTRPAQVSVGHGGAPG